MNPITLSGSWPLNDHSLRYERTSAKCSRSCERPSFKHQHRGFGLTVGAELLLRFIQPRRMRGRSFPIIRRFASYCLPDATTSYREERRSSPAFSRRCVFLHPPQRDIPQKAWQASTAPGETTRLPNQLKETRLSECHSYCQNGLQECATENDNRRTTLLLSIGIYDISRSLQRDFESRSKVPQCTGIWSLGLGAKRIDILAEQLASSGLSVGQCKRYQS